MAGTRDKELGLYLSVRHPESELDGGAVAKYSDGKPILPSVDSDGHYIKFAMNNLSEPTIVLLVIRRGLAPETVVSILTKLANRISAHGRDLLNRKRGSEGEFSPTGTPEFLPPEIYDNYDDDGDPFPREEAK